MFGPLQQAEDGLATSWLTDALLPLILAIIMLGMGLGLRLEHFKLIAKNPRGIAAGLIGQLILLPVAGATVVFFAIGLFDLETDLAIGLLLLAAVPGGATSNLLTWLARGDTALSVSLTAVTSVFSFLLTPTVLWLTTITLWGRGDFIQVPFDEVLKLTLIVVAGPVILGMVLGTKWPRLAMATEKPMRIFSIVFLAVLIAGIIFQNREGFWEFAAATVPAALALNVLALGAGFLMATVFRLNMPQTKSVVIEVGFQNGTFAILLAISQLASPRAALMPGFYSLMMYVTGVTLALGWSRLSKAREPRSAAQA